VFPWSAALLFAAAGAAVCNTGQIAWRRVGYHLAASSQDGVPDRSNSTTDSRRSLGPHPAEAITSTTHVVEAPNVRPAAAGDAPAEVVAVEAPKHHLALTVIAVAVVIVLLQFMQAILVPFVISGLLFYALDPAVDWMQRFRVPRVLARR
jgi:hypothetical protein